MGLLMGALPQLRPGVCTASLTLSLSLSATPLYLRTKLGIHPPTHTLLLCVSGSSGADRLVDRLQFWRGWPTLVKGRRFVIAQDSSMDCDGSMAPSKGVLVFNVMAAFVWLRLFGRRRLTIVSCSVTFSFFSTLAAPPVCVWKDAWESGVGF